MRKLRMRKFGVENRSDERRLERNEPGMILALPIPALSVETGERHDVERAATGVVKGLLTTVSFLRSKGDMNHSERERVTIEPRGGRM